MADNNGAESSIHSASCDQWPLDEDWVFDNVFPNTSELDRRHPFYESLLNEYRCVCLDEHLPYERFRFIVDVLIVCPLSIAGLLGNCLSAIVLRRDSSINYATSLLLGAIAVVDNIYLVSCLLMQTTKAICYYGPSVAGKNATIIGETLCSPAMLDVYPYVERTAWAIANVAMTTVTWLVVVVALGRYCAICRPLDSLRLGTSKRVRKILLAVVFLAIAYNIPAYFEHAVELRLDECRSRHQLRLGYSQLRRDPLYFVIYKTSIYLVFRFLLPLTTLIILNGRLLLTLRRQRTFHVEQRQRSSSIEHYYGAAGRRSRHSNAAETVASRRRRHECLRLRRFSRADDPSVTALVVAMVSLFIVCQLPDLVVRLYHTSGQVHLIFCGSECDADAMMTNRVSTAATITDLDPITSRYARFTTPSDVIHDDSDAVVGASFGYAITTDMSTHSATSQDSDGEDENDEARGSELTVQYWNTVTNALLTLNSSANCFIYCFSGRRFRQHLRQLLCPRRTGTRAANDRHPCRARRRVAVVRQSLGGESPGHDGDGGSPSTSRDNRTDSHPSSAAAATADELAARAKRRRHALRDSTRYSYSGTSTKSLNTEQLGSVG